MAIFSNNTSKGISKRTTPRGSGQLLLQRSESGSTFAPEKTGDSISPSHSTINTNLSSMMEGSSTHSTNTSKPPTGKATLSLLDQKPESMVAETLKMKGELEFTRLLRVDGRFEGELVTDKGSLVVGPKGEVIGELKNMQEVYIEGIVRGNVYANDVKIKNNGMLLGDVQCLKLTLDPSACIKGLADSFTRNSAAKIRATENAPPAPTSTSTSTLSKPSTAPSTTSSTTTTTPTSSTPAPLTPSATAAAVGGDASSPVTLKLPLRCQGVADTATMKERAILDANPAPPSSSSSTGTGVAAAPATTAAAPSTTAAKPVAPPAAADASSAKGAPAEEEKQEASNVEPSPSS